MEYDKIQEIIADHVRKVEQKIQELVLLRLKERVGAAIDFSEEGKRRFPRMKIEHHSDNSRHYYWNDGSFEGLHIISFYQSDLGNSINEMNTYTIGFSYL